MDYDIPHPWPNLLQHVQMTRQQFGLQFTWDPLDDLDYHHVEVWGSSRNDLDTASLLGYGPDRFYLGMPHDGGPLPQLQYFWVRVVYLGPACSTFVPVAEHVERSENPMPTLDGFTTDAPRRLDDPTRPHSPPLFQSPWHRPLRAIAFWAFRCHADPGKFLPHGLLPQGQAVPLNDLDLLPCEGSGVPGPWCQECRFGTRAMELIQYRKE